MRKVTPPESQRVHDRLLTEMADKRNYIDRLPHQFDALAPLIRESLSVGISKTDIATYCNISRQTLDNILARTTLTQTLIK